MPATAPAHHTAESHPSRPRWWTELPLVIVVYAVYSAGRLLARGDATTAVDHGLAILRFEQRWGLNAEHPLNRIFTAHAWVGIPADFAYATLHYLVTPAILIWLWRRRPASYRAARGWLMGSTLLGLIGFTLLPTCPPRLLEAGHGFVDTMAQYSAYGWWGGAASAPRGLGSLTNQFAAMPSLHVGWSLWCGVMLWRHGRGTAARVAGIAYPLLTTLVVMGTANHYFLDAVAGAAVMGAGLLLTPPVLRLVDRARERAGLRPAPGAAVAARSTAPAGARTAIPRPAAASNSTTSPSLITSPGPTTAPGPTTSPSATTSPNPAVPESGTATTVGGGCETSAGERIPRQPSRGGRPDGAATAGPATAGDGTPAAAR
ncbi:phosphatase PAP2 family protein [Streptomyces sp. NPDC001922]|uniref:phosphatase PAP2 family protein n=1 Tax=Streptomyces sp. NPDC001922 TaxID=3364624 RepID=UPI003690426C